MKYELETFDKKWVFVASFDDKDSAIKEMNDRLKEESGKYKWRVVTKMPTKWITTVIAESKPKN